MTADSNEQQKILVLLGSPRKKGNSAILAGKVAEGASAAGAAVETLFIHDMDIKACRSCYACQQKESKGCAIDDDMQSIYPKLVEADAWVISSPVYWFTMSAQTKLWIDRCFALATYGQSAFQKKIGITMAYGDSDPFTSGCINALRTFQDAFRYVGAEICGMVYGSAIGPGEMNQNAGLLAQAEALGKKLAESV